MKEEQTLRLTEIAETCLPAAVRIVAAVRDTMLNTGAAQAHFDHEAFGPMAVSDPGGADGRAVAGDRPAAGA